MNVSVAGVPALGRESDLDLVDRALGGDADAYDQIVRRFQKRIFGVALAIVRDSAKADVITQDTFVQAYLNLAKFERRSGLETWLTRIAVNRSRDVLRERKFVSLDDQNGDDPPLDPRDEAPDAEQRLFASQMQKAIDEAVATLSPQQQMIFRMRHFEDLPLERIAELVGLRAATVRVHLFRAVHRVRKSLSAWAPGVKLTKESVG